MVDNFWEELDKNASGQTDFWAELDEETPSRLESFGRGTLQGATFGFGEEATARIRAIGNPELDALNTQIQKLETDITMAPGEKRNQLIELRDVRKILADKTIADLTAEERKKIEKAQAAHPYIFGAGELGGGVATSLAGGAALGAAGGAASAARVPITLAQRAGRGALTGGTMGGLYGAGTSEAPTLGGRLADAAGGAAVGGAVGTAAPLLGAVASKIPETSKKFFQRGAEKAIRKRETLDVERFGLFDPKEAAQHRGEGYEGARALAGIYMRPHLKGAWSAEAISDIVTKNPEILDKALATPGAREEVLARLIKNARKGSWTETDKFGILLAIGGGVHGGLPGAAALFFGRRGISRYGEAVASKYQDTIAKTLGRAAKYSKGLENLAANRPEIYRKIVSVLGQDKKYIASSLFVLQQKYPEIRQLLRGENLEETEQ